jgi:hypothetical protein
VLHGELRQVSVSSPFATDFFILDLTLSGPWPDYIDRYFESALGSNRYKFTSTEKKSRQRALYAMNLTLATCSCSTCEHQPKLPFLPSGRYGQFLLWAEDGELRYLDAFDDDAYSEVADLVGGITGDPPNRQCR